jgi:hypothetical protein
LQGISPALLLILIGEITMRLTKKRLAKTNDWRAAQSPADNDKTPERDPLAVELLMHLRSLGADAHFGDEPTHWKRKPAR